MTESNEPIDDLAAGPIGGEPDVVDAIALEAIDLDTIEADLDAVQTALDRLADGSYWTDEVTGERIPPEVLAAEPLIRRA